MNVPIVCSHSSIVCLIIKIGLKKTTTKKQKQKMVEISSSLQENEVHRVDSPLNKNSKIQIKSKGVDCKIPKNAVDTAF